MWLIYLQGHYIIATSLLQPQPALTILLIGGNDITSETFLQEVAQAIETLAQQVEDATSSLVIILTIKNRLQSWGMGCD